MPRQPALALLAVTGLLTVGSSGCSSGDAPTAATADTTFITGTTLEPVPSSCNPDIEALPAPTIEADGVTTDASFGIGAYECGTLTGDGYIIYNFNPVLIDADGPIKVSLNSGATATFTWELGEPFAKTGDNAWTSGEPITGCARLTIDLISPGGENTATFGADVRVGGDNVDCPQRVIDATDPGDIGTVPVNTPAPPRSTDETGQTTSPTGTDGRSATTDTAVPRTGG